MLLYENNHLIAVNKPAGLITEQHPKFASAEGWVIAHLSQRYRNPYVGVIHRLDRVTSGVVLFAKKRSALRKLNLQFAERSVQKTYLALTSTALPAQNGTLTDWLEKNNLQRKAIIHKHATANAKKVVLHYELIAATATHFRYKVIPATGKYHQIRAQFAAAGSPIIGDTYYGGKTIAAENTIALHAWQLSFSHPVSNEKQQITAPFPNDWS